MLSFDQCSAFYSIGSRARLPVTSVATDILSGRIESDKVAHAGQELQSRIGDCF